MLQLFFRNVSNIRILVNNLGLCFSARQVQRDGFNSRVLSVKKNNQCLLSMQNIKVNFYLTFSLTSWNVAFNVIYTCNNPKYIHTDEMKHKTNDTV